MLEVLEHGRPVTVFYADAREHHGGSSPGGVAIGFRALERALTLLGPCERAELFVQTPFGGPGAHDAIEYVTGRPPQMVRGLARSDLGRRREKFVFRVGCGDRAVTLVLRDGFVTDEFVGLAGMEERTPEQEQRLDVLKGELAERVMAAPGERLFEAQQPS